MLAWTSRNITNQEGKVEGTVTTKGGFYPATIQLVYEGGAWKVISARINGVELTEYKAP